MIDFEKEVIEKSFHIPVVVDFWAPWCGPCRVLGPIIEQIAKEQAGEWELVKVDTEEQPEISDAFHIRGIPNVKMFYRGEIVHEFSGSIPRQTILDWLKKVLPGKGLQALDKLLAEEKPLEAHDLEQLIAKYPDSDEIRIILAQLLLWEDPQRAAEAIEPIKLSSIYSGKAGAIRDMVSFLTFPTEDQQLLDIRKQLQNAEIEPALLKIIEALSGDKGIGEGRLAKATVGLFSLLGSQHALAKQYRKQVDMYL